MVVTTPPPPTTTNRGFCEDLGNAPQTLFAAGQPYQLFLLPSLPSPGEHMQGISMRMVVVRLAI